MDTNQPASTPQYVPVSAAPGMFGTKVPMATAFAIAILLFLLPFAEIRCGGQPLMNQTGLGFATGQQWKFAGGYGKDMMKDMGTETGGSKKSGNSQIFIIAALALAVIGLAISFADGKTSGRLGMLAGILGGGVLIAFMFDIKKWFNDGWAKQAAEKSSEGADSLGFDKMGDLKPALAVTPWFYIALIAFFAAAFFAYKRMTTKP
jgi:hypothetical protein